MASRYLLLAALPFCMAATHMPAQASPVEREHDRVLHGTIQGRLVPLRTIEASIVPRMRGFDYLGSEFDSARSRYRLKFIRGVQMVWIDVDGRTGGIVSTSGF